MLAFIIIGLILQTSADQQYKTHRQKLLQDEALLSLGGKMQLTDSEDRVNNCLMRYKFNEIDYAIDNPQYFNFSNHYFSYKDRIQDSKVYKIIRDMPKGAALHVHDMAIMSPDYLLNLTYMDHLYVCTYKDNVKFLFSKYVPNEHCFGKWQLLSDVRKASDKADLDAKLRKHFTMVVDDPEKEYANIKDSWDRFLKYFGTVVPIVSYRPVWEKYFFDALKRFEDEKIMYVEVRSVLPQLYELDGTKYNQKITAKAYKKSIDKFKQFHPRFMGAKLIFAPSRLTDRNGLENYLSTARDLKKAVPDIFAGFDLVGPEERGGPLIEFVPQLKAASNDFNFFFHAGETDWYGTTTDENLVDAILLGAKRLGHAYALSKHPILSQEIVKRDIALEVNVISNAVLSLVRDVRNHPLANFLAQGLPVVISSDDPGVWEADVISHDFYVAFVGVASRLSDIRLLKTLAINSLKYSALDSDAKIIAMNMFNEQWKYFIDNFDCSKY